MKRFLSRFARAKQSPVPAVAEPKKAASGSPKERALSVLAVLLGIGVVAIFHVSGKLIQSKWLLSWLWLLPWLYVLEKLRRSGEFRGPQDPLRTWRPLIALVVALVLMLFSSAALHKWFFFLDWAPAGNAVVGLPYRLAFFVLLTTFLIPFLLGRNRRLHWLVLAILLVSQAACFHALLKASGGHALSRDDHPSMMFRLWEVSETWPQLLNYSPYWNGGVVDYAGTASGLNGLGALLRPFLAFGKIQDIYTPAVGAAFIIMVPFLAALSVRVAGGRGVAPWAAGILALGVSQHFFLWLLQYGTLGACLSTTFILPFAASVFRALWLDRREWWLTVLLAGSFVFLLMWPPGALMAATVLLAALVNVRRWSWKRIGYLTLCGLLGVALLYKTVGVIGFHRGEEFSGGLLSAEAGAAGGMTAWRVALEDGWNRLISHLHEVNPVLVVLGFAGAAVFPRRSVRGWFTPILLALAVLCGWGPRALPDLELGRMSIPLAFVAIAPAALAIERVLRTGHFRLALLRAALVSLLILTGWNVASIYAGRQKYFTVKYLGQGTASLTAFIATEAAPGSRVLFAGPSVHGYGDGGHVALLPYLSGHEMMACDYYHFRTFEVEYEYPPKTFREQPDTMFEFMRTYNVSLILARSKPLNRTGVPWAERLRKEPDRYREVGTLADGQVVAFRVAGNRFSMFLKGDGRCDATFNRIRVATTSPADRTVIKYNWQDGLRVKSPVQIRPYRIADGLNLIEIVWNGQSECTLTYDNVW